MQNTANKYWNMSFSGWSADNAAQTHVTATKGISNPDKAKITLKRENKVSLYKDSL